MPGKKEKISQFCMKFLALTISVYAGIQSGIYVIQNELYTYFFLPLWNILIGVFFIYSTAFIDKVPFDQRDATPSQVKYSLFIVFMVFCMLYFVRHEYWAIVFSICVSYAFCLNNAVLNGTESLKTKLKNKEILS